MATKKERDKKYDEKRKGARSRNYATVVYPESAPADWQERLASMHVEAFVSPLHDQDLNPGGEAKKAHYHVLVMWPVVKTKEQAALAFEEIGGVGVERVASLRGMARYLCHLDNPEKAQYSADEVKCFGGAKYLQIIGLPTDKFDVIGEMIDFCEQKNIQEYGLLLTLARVSNERWYQCLCTNGSYVMKNYLSSKRHASFDFGEKVAELLAEISK